MPALSRVIAGTSVAAALFMPPAALANPVGLAEAVAPAAQTESPRGAVILAKGVGVNAFDRVRTSVDGAVTLRFKDSSLLEVGPGSVVTIDRFVYNADNTASDAAITMARGTFRWVSGSSRKEAYTLKTPAATLGVRGTEFVVVADAASTSVALKHGAVRACNAASGRCGDITRAGQGLKLWKDGRIEPFSALGLVQQHAARIQRIMPHHRPGGPGGSGGQGGPGAAGPQGQLQPSKQQWTGSYVPQGGAPSSLKTPEQVDRMPMASTGLYGALRQTPGLTQPRWIAQQSGFGQPGLHNGPAAGIRSGLTRPQQPGPVEKKLSADIPVTFR